MTDTPGRTVWLASFPKSGNTWMRAIITALGTHEHLFAVNRLGSGSQPQFVHPALQQFGLDARWLSRDEVDRLRTVLVTDSGAAADDGLPLLRKTHEVYRDGPAGREPFPRRATRAAILVVRDPRDVACSYAPFFGIGLDQAIDAMGVAKPAGKADPAQSSTAQPWGSWSSHALSWLDPQVPFPVHLVRYEDLQEDAVATLLPVLHAVGMHCTQEDLEAAVERTHFDRLQRSETERGFREASKKTTAFFRRGVVGGWRDELSPAQVAAIEADHADVMQQLGYELTTAKSVRTPLAEARQSRRRAAQHDWMHLPESLGITVTRGPVPTSLPNAAQARPWILVNERQALLRFGTHAALLVEDGDRVTVDLNPRPDSPGDDPSWLVQGWAVTLAMLQRGKLSLHAATVSIDGHVVAIAGNRGAGKSTTAMALRARGHHLLVDDVTLIDLHDGEAWTMPYPRNVHLLPDAAAALGLDFEGLPRLSGGRLKAAFRPEEPPQRSYRIDHIVILSPVDGMQPVDAHEIRGHQRVAALSRHTDRDGIAAMVMGGDTYFKQLAQLADRVRVHEILRDAQGWSLSEVVRHLEEIADT